MHLDKKNIIGPIFAVILRPSKRSCVKNLAYSNFVQYIRVVCILAISLYFSYLYKDNLIQPGGVKQV